MRSLMRPLRLKDAAIRNRKESKPAICVEQMNALMNCWKSSAFDDRVCRRELMMLTECVAANAAAAKPPKDNIAVALTSFNKVR